MLDMRVRSDAITHALDVRFLGRASILGTEGVPIKGKTML